MPVIGNTYAGAALIGLTAILDVAEPGDRILMVSFGSGRRLGCLFPARSPRRSPSAATWPP